MDLLLFMILVTSATSAYASSASEPWLNRCLPRSLTPIHYDLFIQPDVWKREFDGNVSIQMAVLKETKFFIVHVARMNISNIQVFVNETKELTVTRSFSYDPNNFLVVETKEPMMQGAMAKVNMKFRGVLQCTTGITSNGHTNVQTGEHSPLITTKFKPNYARFAFPNFDDPFFKSRFTITIRHWANCTAVSNMPAERVKNFDSVWVDTTFEKTPDISSFAVSFAINNYAFENHTLLDGKQMENVSSLSHRLFIYGTLKRGQPNSFHLENYHGHWRLIGSAVTQTAFPLVIATRWNIPFLLYAPEKGQQIYGEIYAIDDQLLELLDKVEGHPDVYVRDKITANLLSNGVSSCKGCGRLGKVECWVYFLKKFPPQMLELETYSSYNSYGCHNKVLKVDENLYNATSIEEELNLLNQLNN